jgi:16S rRNA (guanine966-N2)-methyltransferase
MTRIVAGTAGGRRLRTSPGSATRPTSERVREGMFSSVHSILGSLAGLRVLDVFAGSGALGLEALSRGAGHATFVEASRAAADQIRRNAAELALPAADVMATKAELLMARRPVGGPFDLVLADPPYDLQNPVIEQLLGKLLNNGWLSRECLVVLERSSRQAEPHWPAGLRCIRNRSYGQTVLWYVARTPAISAEQED